jgi:hypothetical protein
MRMKYKVVATLIALLTLAASGFAADTGTYTEICKFNGYWPPNCPTSALVMDASSNLYGTSGYGEYDVVNELSPAGGDVWTANQLFYFSLYSGYNTSQGPLAIDKNGNLYGTTFFGGLGTNQVLCYNALEGCGTVYELSPSENGWIENTLYYFQGLNIDGGNPAGGLTMVSPTRFFGTTSDQGAYGYGTVFELQYSKGQGSWIEKTIYNFPPQPVGIGPTTGVIPKGGNLYGTTGSEIYELTPAGKGEWSANILYSAPDPGVIDFTFGQDGNMYGTCDSCVTGDGSGSANGAGQIFELAQSDGQWTMKILHIFGTGQDGAYPVGGLVWNKPGTFYGQTEAGGVADAGTLFEMTSKLTESGEVWTETTLHSFPVLKGDLPYATMFIDKSGNLYGTDGCGNDFEFTP